MKSKFLYQDVDVVSLADKGIVVICFVCRNYGKVLMETGKLCDNIRVTKMDSCLVLIECLSRWILRLSTSPIDLIHSERVSSSTSSFFAHRLAYAYEVYLPMLLENQKKWIYSGLLVLLLSGSGFQGFISYKMAKSLLASACLGTFGSSLFDFLNFIFLLRITDNDSVPEMRVWSILLIKSDNVYILVEVSFYIWTRLVIPFIVLTAIINQGDTLQKKHLSANRNGTLKKIVFEDLSSNQMIFKGLMFWGGFTLLISQAVAVQTGDIECSRVPVITSVVHEFLNVLCKAPSLVQN